MSKGSRLSCMANLRLNPHYLLLQTWASNLISLASTVKWEYFIIVQLGGNKTLNGQIA